MTVAGVISGAEGLRLQAVSLESATWTSLLADAPEATAFHHPAWVRTVSECYGFRAFGLTLADDQGHVVAGLPVVEVKGPLQRRTWVSLPFTDACPPLTRGHLPDDLAGRFLKEARRHGVSTLRVRAPLPLVPHVHTEQAAVHHTLTLGTDLVDMQRRITKMHRRNIVRAERAGVTVERGGAAADMDTFYDLHVLTRQRLGVPVQPRRFFQSLQRYMFAQGLGFTLTARIGNRPVASAVFLCWNDVLIYKYGASDRRFLEHRPNNALFWEAIRWGVANGYRLLDWGRSDLEDAGLRGFKAGWGAHEQPLVYSTISSSAPRPAGHKSHHVLASVIRRSPPWVGRVIGELLYRYAA